jgi:hypothetical protein
MSLPIQVPLVSLSRVSMAQHLLKLFKAGIVDLTNLRIGIQLILGINAFSGYRFFKRETLSLAIANWTTPKKAPAAGFGR